MYFSSQSSFCPSRHEHSESTTSTATRHSSDTPSVPADGYKLSAKAINF